MAPRPRAGRQEAPPVDPMRRGRPGPRSRASRSADIRRPPRSSGAAAAARRNSSRGVSQARLGGRALVLIALRQGGEGRRNLPGPTGSAGDRADGRANLARDATPVPVAARPERGTSRGSGENDAQGPPQASAAPERAPGEGVDDEGIGALLLDRVAQVRRVVPGSVAKAPHRPDAASDRASGSPVLNGERLDLGGDRLGLETQGRASSRPRSRSCEAATSCPRRRSSSRTGTIGKRCPCMGEV